MPTNPRIDEPVTLTGLFPPDSDDEGDEPEEKGLCYEVQSVVLARSELRIRQFDYHSHNANRVWPGTFNLADYLLARDDTGKLIHQWGDILELGTATGLLAIRLALASTVHRPDGSPSAETICDKIMTSDVQDERNEILANLEFNYQLNNVSAAPLHIPHTWGTGFVASADRAVFERQQETVPASPTVWTFDTIVASDILLYVSAYPALVKTLQEVMPADRKETKFVMSWNRRMKESAAFFDMMEEAGFQYKHEGKCVYTFTRRS